MIGSEEDIIHDRDHRRILLALTGAVARQLGVW
jgi:hypothetical protein